MLTPCPISVRPYRAENLDALIDLFRGSVRAIARRDYSHEQVVAWAPDHIDRHVWAVRRGVKPIWVAEVDGALAGFIDLEPDGHIDMLYVSADHQGRGVANALYREGEAATQARGLDRLYTEASITARPFFERQGFRIITKQTARLGGQEFVNYRMEKQLSGLGTDPWSFPFTILP